MNRDRYEALQVIYKRKDYGPDIYQCPACKYRLSTKRKKINYCSNCGQKLIWDYKNSEDKELMQFSFTVDADKVKVIKENEGGEA